MLARQPSKCIPALQPHNSALNRLLHVRAAPPCDCDCHAAGRQLCRQAGVKRRHIGCRQGGRTGGGRQLVTGAQQTLNFSTMPQMWLSTHLLGEHRARGRYMAQRQETNGAPTCRDVVHQLLEQYVAVPHLAGRQLRKRHRVHQHWLHTTVCQRLCGSRMEQKDGRK